MSNHPSPPADLSKLSLLVTRLRCAWYRIHSLTRGPIYFNPSADYRFNAPAGEFSVLYLARDLHGAFAETLLHDTGNPLVEWSELASRGVVKVTFDRTLRLVDLRGKGLARAGADASLTCGPDTTYNLCHRWAKAFHDHPRAPDGILYRARHDPERVCAAIFNRAEPHLKWSRLGRSLVDPMHSAALDDIFTTYGLAL